MKEVIAMFCRVRACTYKKLNGFSRKREAFVSGHEIIVVGVFAVSLEDGDYCVSSVQVGKALVQSASEEIMQESISSASEDMK